MVSEQSKLQDPSQGDGGARTPKCAAALRVGPIVEQQQGAELTLASNLKCKLWLLEMFSRALIFGKSPARCSSSSQDGRAVQGAAFRSQSPLEAWVRIPLLTWLALSCHSRLKPDTGWDLGLGYVPCWSARRRACVSSAAVMFDTLCLGHPASLFRSHRKVCKHLNLCPQCELCLGLLAEHGTLGHSLQKCYWKMMKWM